MWAFVKFFRALKMSVRKLRFCVTHVVFSTIRAHLYYIIVVLWCTYMYISVCYYYNKKGSILLTFRDEMRVLCGAWSLHIIHIYVCNMYVCMCMKCITYYYIVLWCKTRCTLFTQFFLSFVSVSLRIIHWGFFYTKSIVFVWIVSILVSLVIRPIFSKDCTIF